MRIKSNFKIRSIASENILINQGTNNVDTTKIITLNSSARMLFETMQGKDFSNEDAAKALVEKYGITMEKATEDANHWIEKLKSCGIIE